MPKRLHFDQTEYDRRLLMTRMAMALAGLDGLLVSDLPNVEWLTGQFASSHHHQGVIVLQDADPIWWGRRQDTGSAIAAVWMPDGCVIGYDGDANPAEYHPMEDLARHLDGIGVQNLGIEMDSNCFSAKAFSILLQALPNVGFADATGMVDLQRLIKSDPEISVMRKAAEISEKIVDGLVARVGLGASKHEVTADAYRDAILGGAGVSGASAEAPPISLVRFDGLPVNSLSEETEFVAGEVAAYEVSGCYQRYTAPIGRTLVLSQLSDKMKRAEAALMSGISAGIEAARAGERICDIANAVGAQLVQAEGEQATSFGHSIGLSNHFARKEHATLIRSDNEMVLEPNMTFQLMAGLRVDGCDLQISDSIRVAEDGMAERFCDRPLGFYVKT
jgi:ectoine hydrolase